MSDGWLTLTVDVPANTSATVFRADARSIVRDRERPTGRAVSPASVRSKPADQAAVFEVGSGHYMFRARWRQNPSRRWEVAANWAAGEGGEKNVRAYGPAGERVRRGRSAVPPPIGEAAGAHVEHCVANVAVRSDLLQAIRLRV